jgi:3-oxoacyl-[acyl-carrier protein] reductase
MASETRGVAVISGGGTGIGREIALDLARRGYALALLGRRTQPLIETLRAAGGNGIALPCDVRAASTVDGVARQIETRWGAAEIVVPAAGVAHIAPLDELDPDDFSETLAINLVGSFHLIRSLLPAMKRRGSGWIFPILSTAARRGFPGWSAYCASKWGLAGLIAALREEIQGTGVRITSVYPGATATAIWNSVPGEWNRAAMIPPREVARAIGCSLEADPAALVEEIHLGPVGGAL